MPTVGIHNMLTINNETHSKHEDSQWKIAFAGGAAAAVTRVFAQPFDVIKIRFQLQVEPLKHSNGNQSKYVSMVQASKLILKEEGSAAFWKGHTPAQILSIIYGVAQFCVYEQCKNKAKDWNLYNDHKNISNFVCGGIAGASGTLVTTPLDVIRTRLIAQDKNRGYPNTWKAFSVIIKADGVRGIYRGLLPGILQVTPLTGINFMFYNLFCSTTVDMLELTSKSQIPAPIAFVNGAVAGLTSKFFLYPLDLTKKRMQIQGFSEHRQSYGSHFQCSGIITCIRTTIKREGMMGMYKGIMPSIWKASLTSALNFCIYDNIVCLLIK